MKVSVVITTYQRRQILERTLPTILAQDFDPTDYEVIVVVDGSTDGTLDLLCRLPLSSCRFQVIAQPNHGLAAARNAGLRAAVGDIVLFLDDDLLCHETLVRRHFEAHCLPGDWIVSGLVLPPPGPRSLAGEIDALHLQHLASSIPANGCAQWPDVDCGANDSAPRALLLEIGGNDERFRDSREEADLALRLWKKGARLRYQLEAIAYHLYDKSPDDLVFGDSVRSARGEILLCRLHPEYRPFSRLTQVFHQALLQRWCKQLAARLPVSEPILRRACRLAEACSVIPGMRRLALPLLKARMLTAELRTAVALLGSWRAFKQEFGLPAPAMNQADLVATR